MMKTVDIDTMATIAINVGTINGNAKQMQRHSHTHYANKQDIIKIDPC